MSASTLVRTVSFIALVVFTTSCEFTEKDVSKPLTKGQPGATDITVPPIDQPESEDPENVPLDEPDVTPTPTATPVDGADLSVTSHFNQQKVESELVQISGTCRNSLGSVIITGPIQGTPVNTTCSSGVFSQSVLLQNFNTTNALTFAQGTQNQNLMLVLFARAAYCGDGVINQNWEICDGGAGCLDTCQSLLAQHANLQLARLTIKNLTLQGSASTTNEVFVGSSSHSIPSGKWFALAFEGTFFVDSATTLFESAPGLIVRRMANELKVLMKASGSGSDLQHMRGTIEFHGAAATGVSNGLSSEAAENASDGQSALDAQQDEIFIESGISNFWFSETSGGTLGKDAYFTQWM